MSNSLAIAAVTATLRNVLTTGVTDQFPDVEPITVKPLDKARVGRTSNQLNVFLYQTMPNAAWRNMDIPQQVKPGETGHPPLALALYYLVTAFGQGDDDDFGHRVLGRAMSVLHDHPLLDAHEIRDALAENDLHEQVERVRITLQPLTLDEMSKLWSTFQTQYRISAAYQVSVVLIDSTQPAKTPLPVLTRGPGDQGVSAQPDLIPPFPTIQSVRPPNNQPSAHLGDILTITGHHLEGETVALRFMNPRLTDPIIEEPETDPTATEIQVTLPEDEPDEWPAGLYTLSVVITRPDDQDRRSNELPFALAPQITTALPIEVVRNAAETATITLTCRPQVLPGQHATLLLSDREVLAEDHPAQTDTLTFIVTEAPLGEHYIRLRVDGVDSVLVDRTVSPPIFDATQKVTIT